MNECFFSAFVYVSKRKQDNWNFRMKKRFITLSNNSMNIVLWNSQKKDVIIDCIDIINSVFVMEYEESKPVLSIRFSLKFTKMQF